MRIFSRIDRCEPFQASRRRWRCPIADLRTISPYPTVVAVLSEKYTNVCKVGLDGNPANESDPASPPDSTKKRRKPRYDPQVADSESQQSLAIFLRSWNVGCKATIHLLTLRPSMSPSQRPPK